MRVARLVARLLDSALSRAENEDCCLGVAEEEFAEDEEEEEEEEEEEDNDPMSKELLADPAACCSCGGGSFSGDASSPKASTTVDSSMTAVLVYLVIKVKLPLNLNSLQLYSILLYHTTPEQSCLT